MFFQSAPSGALETELTAALSAAPPSSNEVPARVRAHASAVRAANSALKPNLPAFAAAAVVFMFLVVAAYLSASSADANTSTTATQMRDLSKAITDLLVAWSGAVLGLIGGEAVGKKSAS